MVLDPKILVIDEPNTSLDWTGVRQLMTLIKKLNRQGSTIIIITHDMDSVARYTDRVLVMQNGFLLADAPRKRFSVIPLDSKRPILFLHR